MDELLKSFKEKLTMDVSTLWKTSKIFLIIFGVIILIVKARDFYADYLVASSEKLTKDTEKKSDQLKKEENQANDEANKLIEEAKKLAENKPDVKEDWYRK